MSRRANYAALAQMGALRDWVVSFSGSRPDHAGQSVVDAHRDAHDLAGAKGAADRNPNPGAADFDPTRPTGSVVHIGVEGTVQLTDRAAHQQSGSLCGAVCIVGDRPAESAVGGPIGGRPQSPKEFRAVDSRVVGLTKACDFATGVHGRAIQVAGRKVAPPTVTTAQTTPPALSVAQPGAETAEVETVLKALQEVPL